MQVTVRLDRGVEEDGEGQVEVEREDEEVRENRTSWLTWREDDGHLNDLSQEDHDSRLRQETRLNSALLCSLVQIARVVIVRVILVGVLGVMIVVLIGRHRYCTIHVAIFVVIFCNWRCTLYRTRHFESHSAAVRAHEILLNCFSNRHSR